MIKSRICWNVSKVVPPVEPLVQLHELLTLGSNDEKLVTEIYYGTVTGFIYTHQFGDNGCKGWTAQNPHKE